jgi:hypothetical protein
VVRKDKCVLIAVDRDGTHLDMKGLDIAEYGGVVMSRPTHTSVTVEPLDKSVFWTI